MYESGKGVLGPDAGLEIEISQNIDHPAHYKTGKFECIDVMEEVLGTEAVKRFCICNALKYLYRCQRKNGIEDVRKAEWYLKKYIELSERDRCAGCLDGKDV